MLSVPKATSMFEEISKNIFGTEAIPIDIKVHIKFIKVKKNQILKVFSKFKRF
jgi:hypothetical protein